MPKYRLVVITRNQQEFQEKLEVKKLPDLETMYPQTNQEIVSAIETADILLANPIITANYINQAKNLQWMQATFTGIDAMIKPHLKKDYILTNLRETYGSVIGEYVMGYLLYFTKEIAENRIYQSKKQWMQRPTREIAGKTIGILGTGSIGKEIARLAKALKMHTIGFRATHKPVENFDEIVTADGLSELLRQSDFVVAALPATEETKHFLKEEQFAQMKRSAIFINVGRGNLVEEQVLVSVLQKNLIHMAVLDVLPEEPLPPESLLWDLSNAIITPHLSGDIVLDRIFDVFEENYLRFRNGEPLLYQIDFQKGY